MKTTDTAWRPFDPHGDGYTQKTYFRMGKTSRTYYRCGNELCWRKVRGGSPVGPGYGVAPATLEDDGTSVAEAEFAG